MFDQLRQSFSKPYIRWDKEARIFRCHPSFFWIVDITGLTSAVLLLIGANPPLALFFPTGMFIARLSRACLGETNLGGLAQFLEKRAP